METANLALFTVSADLIAPADPRSSMSICLLGVAVGVFDANERRGTRGDEAFVVGTLGDVKNLCTLQRHQPPDLQPCFVVVFVLFVCLILAKV